MTFSLIHCQYIPKTILYKNAYELLLDLPWQPEEVIVFNKLHILDRQACRYGNNESQHYTGLGIKRNPIQEWPFILTELTKIMNRITKELYPDHPDYNFVLCNYYPNGKASIGYHEYDEKDYMPYACIGSLSFGGTRDFTIKSKVTKCVEKIPLGNGDVFIMAPGFQQLYKHSVLKRVNAQGRINLTFRSFK